MKILACDYDGTLNRGGGVTEADILAIRRWQQAGNLFGINSGRTWDSVFSVWRGVPIAPDFVIADNGAQIFLRGGARIKSIDADASLLPEVVNMLIDWGAKYIWFSSDDGSWICSSDGNFPEHFSEIPCTRDSLPKISRVRRFASYFDEDGRSVRFCEEFMKLYSKDFFATPNMDMVDIVAAGVDKAQGIIQFISLTGIKPELVVTCGDGGNDIPMLREFYGFVPEGAPDYVKDAVGRTTPDIAFVVDCCL